jgi:hypothetical protein
MSADHHDEHDVESGNERDLTICHQAGLENGSVSEGRLASREATNHRVGGEDGAKKASADEQGEHLKAVELHVG